MTWRCSVIIQLGLREGNEPCSDRAKELLALPGVSGIHLLCAGPDDVEVIYSLSGIIRKG